jgi:hypothetical protein
MTWPAASDAACATTVCRPASLRHLIRFESETVKAWRRELRLDTRRQARAHNRREPLAPDGCVVVCACLLSETAF